MKKLTKITAILICFFLISSFRFFDSNEKTGNSKTKLVYSFTVSTGHAQPCSAEFCPNCIGCIPLVLVPCHIPCWGSGSNCSHTFTIEFNLSPVKSDGSYDVLDANLDLINESDIQTLSMPDRSVPIQIDGADKYLNIPHQTIVVSEFDPNKNVIYSFSNLTITSSPIYQ